MDAGIREYYMTTEELLPGLYFMFDLLYVPFAHDDFVVNFKEFHDVF